MEEHSQVQYLNLIKALPKQCSVSFLLWFVSYPLKVTTSPKTVIISMLNIFEKCVMHTCKIIRDFHEVRMLTCFQIH